MTVVDASSSVPPMAQPLAEPSAERGTLSRMFGGRDKAPLGQRLRNALLKPPDPSSVAAAPDAPRTVEELEATVKYADDKERIVGLFAAPIAAAIGLIITGAD